MEVIDLDELFGDSSKSNEEHTKEDNKKSRKPDRQNNQKKRKKGVIQEMLRFILTIIIVSFAAYLIVVFIGQRTKVNGSSMETTLFDGDNLIIDKVTYKLFKPKRFDIIVFPHKTEEKELFYIKRIIGLPGEQVQISDGVIYINNVPLEENFGSEVINDAKLAASPVLLGDDEYFVLGDNRNHSSDSREIGPVKKNTIVGKAVIRIWPIEKIKILK